MSFNFGVNGSTPAEIAAIRLAAIRDYGIRVDTEMAETVLARASADKAQEWLNMMAHTGGEAWAIKQVIETIFHTTTNIGEGLELGVCHLAFAGETIVKWGMSYFKEGDVVLMLEEVGRVTAVYSVRADKVLVVHGEQLRYGE